MGSDTGDGLEPAGRGEARERGGLAEEAQESRRRRGEARERGGPGEQAQESRPRCSEAVSSFTLLRAL